MADCTPGSDFPTDSRPDTTPNIGPADLVPPGTAAEDLARSSCSAAQQVVSVIQNQKTRLALVFVDQNGVSIDISAVVTPRVRFVVKDSVASTTKVLDTDGVVTDAVAGTVRVAVAYQDLKQAGIYHSQILLYNADAELLLSTSYWLAVEPALDSTSWTSPEPITLPEVRLVLRDACAAENLLLQDFEFSDTEIVTCMRLPVYKFNETNQPRTRYTGRNFPYHWHWLRATCAYLLEIKARGYARDQLAYSAGGVSVNDKDKASIYQGLANALLAEWEQFVVDEKLQLNIAGGFGMLGSGYRRTTYSSY